MPLSRPLQSITVNGVHRFATCWKIERRDGQVYRLTDHNRPLTVDSETYTPIDSISASARQSKEDLENNTLEVHGAISSATIQNDDLRGGRFREAKLTEFLVDWRFPFAGKFKTSVFWISETTFTGEVWQAQLVGIVHKLRQKVGGMYGRSCRWALGDDNCGVDLTSLTSTGTVDLVVVTRRTFRSSLSIVQPDGYYGDGLLTWTSGLNDGLTGEIRGHLEANGNLALHLPMPFDIEVGDTFTVYPGCRKVQEDCKNKFNNFNNFGGFPHIPGTDKALETPNAQT